ncbi:MAG TPA: ComEC/Rec2 family competence protein [Pirellulales bacterium]|nr:ComEC/Rec2 family competence protein [Pirellulales bacterium]
MADQRLATVSDSPRQPRYQPLVLMVAMVTAGIVADRFCSPTIPTWLIAGHLAWGSWFAARGLRHPLLGTALLGLSLAALGGAWHHLHWSSYDPQEIGLFADEVARPAALRAVALGTARYLPARDRDPLMAIPRRERSRFLVRVTSIRDGEAWRRASGLAEVWVDGVVTDVGSGDRMEIVGQLSAISGPQNPGEFDFARHGRADRQLSRLSADFLECVDVQERGGRWSPSRLFDDLRRRGQDLLKRHIDASRAGLASALLLGVREDLDDETNAAFAKTGTVHLLSISGLHVGILSVFLFGVLRMAFIGRRPALAAVSLVTVAYALTIAAEPPAVRATIVVLLVSLSMLLRRRWQPLNLLAAAALVVVLMNPCDLFRIGPQLSFLAVAVLVWSGARFGPTPITDPLDRLIAATRPWHERVLRRSAQRSRQALATTFAVWGTSVPLVLAQFHLLSPATLILTPVLAIPVFMALSTGFLLLTVGWLGAPVAGCLGAACDGSLWLIDTSVDYAGSLGWSHLWAPGPAFWWLCGFYAAMGVWTALPRYRPPRRWCLGCLACWMSLGFLLPIAAKPREPRLVCTFLSVGHGCAVLLELPAGEKVLYDAGRLGSPAAGARSVASYLWHRGVTHLDAIVLSHADVDHYNAVPELLEKFGVGVVYTTPAMLQDEGAGMQTLVSAVRRAGVPLRETWSGDRLRVGGECLLEVWHPTRSGVLGSDNANSLVLDIEYRDKRILLTGDLETPGMDDLLSESPCHCDVILTPHHGSARSNPPGFAAWSTPDVAIVSGGFNDRRPEVDRAYIQHGARVFNTADSGAIRVIIDAGGVHVSTWKQQTPSPPSADESF